jgi:hypothetical protein
VGVVKTNADAAKGLDFDGNKQPDGRHPRQQPRHVLRYVKGNKMQHLCGWCGYLPHHYVEKNDEGL